MHGYAGLGRIAVRGVTFHRHPQRSSARMPMAFHAEQINRARVLRAMLRQASGGRLVWR
jgi:hypothetical protein